MPSGGSPPLGAPPSLAHLHANSSQLHFPLVNGGGGDPRTWSPDSTWYASYMPTPNSHSGDTIESNGKTMDKLVAFGTGAQCSWAGTRGSQAVGLVLESPGCEVNQRQPYRVGAVSDCPRPSITEAGCDQLVSVLATRTPNKRKPPIGRSESATLRPGGLAADDEERVLSSHSGKSPLRPSTGYREPLEQLQFKYSARGSPIPGGDNQNASPHPGQLRDGTGEAASKAIGRPYGSKPRIPQNVDRASSHRPCSSITTHNYQQHCPEGFKIYKKDAKEEKNIKSGWRTKRRGAKNGVQNSNGECETDGEKQPKPTQPPNQNPGQFSKSEVCINVYERQTRLILGEKLECYKTEKKQHIRTCLEISVAKIQEFDGKPRKDPKSTRLASEVQTNLYGPVSVGYPRPDNSRPRGRMFEVRVGSIWSQPRDTLAGKECNATKEFEAKPNEQQNKREKHIFCLSSNVTSNSTCDEPRTSNHQETEPTCENDHEMRSHVVNDHATEHHEIYQYHRGEAEREEIGRSLSQCPDEMINGEPQLKGNSNEEPTCDGNHAMQDHDVNDHAIEHHVIYPEHRGDADGTSIEKVELENQRGIEEDEQPWFATKILWQYLEQRMNTEEPTTWSIDDYDGKVSWQELKQQPSIDHEHDVDMNPNQYHKLMHALYQLESITDELVEKQELSGCNDGNKKEWLNIKDQVKTKCMEMFKEMEYDETQDEVQLEKERAQEKYNRRRREMSNAPQQFAMLEKKNKKRKTRKQIEDESSDEEEQCQLVCNMTGDRWEPLPSPIIIDPGACASVMPTRWCEHVPIKQPPQSQAGEYFRAANGQKIHNHSEKVVSMIIKEGAMKDMKFTICDVSKALRSISQMCRAGHRVVFNPPWDPTKSYIQHVQTGENMWLEEQNGLYVLNTKVAPAERQSGNKWSQPHNTGFGWPANPLSERGKRTSP